MRHLRHLGPLARRHWPNVALALLGLVVSLHVVPELAKFLGVGRHTTAAAARAVGPKDDPLPPPMAPGPHTGPQAPSATAPAVRQAPSMVWPLPPLEAGPTTTSMAPEAPAAPPPPAPEAPLPPPPPSPR